MRFGFCQRQKAFKPKRLTRVKVWRPADFYSIKIFLKNHYKIFWKESQTLRKLRAFNMVFCFATRNWTRRTWRRGYEIDFKIPTLGGKCQTWRQIKKTLKTSSSKRKGKNPSPHFHPRFSSYRLPLSPFHNFIFTGIITPKNRSVREGERERERERTQLAEIEIWGLILPLCSDTLFIPFGSSVGRLLFKKWRHFGLFFCSFVGSEVTKCFSESTPTESSAAPDKKKKKLEIWMLERMSPTAEARK